MTSCPHASRPRAFVDRAQRIALAAMLAAGLATLGALASAPARADTTTSDVLAPNAHLQLRGVPPIPARLARRLEPYTRFTPRTAVSWHPVRRELVVSKRAGNTTQLHALARPDGPLVQLTWGADPVRSGFYFAPKPDVVVFGRDSGGNEQGQIYRLDPGAAEPVLLTDPARRHRIAALTHARDRMLVVSTSVDRNGRTEAPTTELVLMDPLEPQKARRVAVLPGTGWGAFTFSFDDERIAMAEGISATHTVVWIMNVDDGERRVVVPGTKGDGATVASGDLAFTRGGTGLFLSTDRDGEFARLAHLDLQSGRIDYFGESTRWDVSRIVLSPDGATLAVTANENGVGVLRIYDAVTRTQRALPKLGVGTVTGTIWHQNSRDLAFTLQSARSPGEVYVLDTQENRVEQWTHAGDEGVDPDRFQEPAAISWKSFDGRMIPGFITRPPQSAKRPVPVLIQIHGGPESQARPGFIGRWNFAVNEMGVAIIEPNVRGSAGYGKTFLSLDDGRRREDSVKDIGALLDWIARQPDLDATRVAVSGGSYGGYMSLAVSTHYADRIAGTIDVVGIANFVSFLEHTESYRRDLRRVEYGDERDRPMREFLTRISPVSNATRIAKPLLVVHGRNDPRVPYTEAEQIVTTLEARKVPVWYILADNEGHGFARKDNADFYFTAAVKFLQDVLKAQ